MNWKVTFSEPILAELSAGRIGDARDWADLITKNYVNTIKTGTAQSFPSALPAPGLNPLAPPPFPLLQTPLQPSTKRVKAFNTIIYAYFASKDLALTKEAVKQLAKDIKDIINQIKTAQQEVRTLIEEIKLVREELKQLPEVIKEILGEIQAEIDFQKNEIKGLFDSLNPDGALSKEFSVETIQTLFKKEIEAFNVFKNFKIGDLSSITDLQRLFTDIEKAIKSAESLGKTDSVTIIKGYIQKRLFEIFKQFIDLATNLDNPNFLLKYLKGLSSRRPKLAKLIDLIRKMEYLLGYLQPQLKRLDRKKRELVKKIQIWLQARLKNVQDMYQKKLSEFKNKVKNSKLVTLFKNAKKNIDEFKKTHEKDVKKWKKNIQLSLTIVKKSNGILEKIQTLKGSIQEEFEVLKKEIEEYEAKLNKTFSSTGSSITKDLERGATAATQNNTQLINSLAETDLKNLSLKIQQLEDYIKGLGGVDPVFSAIMLTIVQTTNCEINTFKKFFEKKNKLIVKYAAVFASISDDIKGLSDALRELKGNNEGGKIVEKTSKGLSNFKKTIFFEYMTSFKDLTTWGINWLITQLRSIAKKAKEFVKEAKIYVNKKLATFREELEIMAINLVPASIRAQDIESKKIEAEAKKRKIKFRLNQAKEIYDMIKQSALMIEGGATMVSNIASGKYFFTDNEGAFNKFIDGYYGIRLERNEANMYTATGKSSMLADRLLAEKKAIKNDFQGLLLVEVIVRSVYEIIKDITQTDFLKELKEFAAGSTAEIKEKLAPFINFIETPPSSINDLLNKAEQASLAIISDLTIVNKIKILEKRYLGKSRQIIKNLIYLNKTDEFTPGFKTVADKLQTEKYKRALQSIDAALNKKTSFIDAILKVALDHISKFFKWLSKILKQAFAFVKNKIKERRLKRIEEKKKDAEDEIRKRVNVDAKVMSIVFSLAARAFWTGTSWTGPTGIRFVALTLGKFKPIKGLAADGGSALIAQIAEGFERQTMSMKGLVIPPANTLIPPLPFSGYYNVASVGGTITV